MSPSFTMLEVATSLVPSHSGVRGNEGEDSDARSALALLHVKVRVRYTDYKHCKLQSVTLVLLQAE